jgi:hypothetical protein
MKFLEALLRWIERHHERQLAKVRRVMRDIKKDKGGHG